MTEFRRYHYTIGFPEYHSTMISDIFNLFNEYSGLTVTRKFLEQKELSKVDMPIPTKNDLLNMDNTVVEIYETLDNNGKPTGQAQKVLIRCHHLSDVHDFSYVVSRVGFIVSGWANRKTDIHRLNHKDIYYYA